MPRSKRDKKVSLTKINRKGLSWKQHIIDDIRHCVERYPNIFVFSVENMRNNLLKELRQEMKQNSRFFFGKNRIMQIGLGRTESEETEIGLHKLSKRLQGQCGLLFTHKSKEDILEWAKNYWAIEYARSGFIATETVILKQGPLEEFSHAIEPHLRSLGLPTKLEKGIVTLIKDHTVCEKDKMLTPEQARILKLTAKPMAKFKLTIKCSWSKENGFESYLTDNDEGDDNIDENGDNDEEENALEDVEMDSDEEKEEENVEEISKNEKNKVKRSKK